MLKYQRDVEEENRSMDEFFDRLLEKENVTSQKNLTKIKLMALKQIDSFDDYFNKFQQLANVVDMREEGLILLFTNGLRSKARFEVQVRKPKTLDDAYKFASKFEQYYQKTKNSEGQKFKSNYIKTNFGSHKNKVRNNDFRKNKFRDTRVTNKSICFNCSIHLI